MEFLNCGNYPVSTIVFYRCFFGTDLGHGIDLIHLRVKLPVIFFS